MDHNKNESFFWTSYADLMTSLFFVMLVLFVLVIALLHNRINIQSIELDKYKMIDTTQYKFLIDAEESIKKIDKNYFEFNEEFKRYTLKDINIEFHTGSADILDIPLKERNQLVNVGQAIIDFISIAISTNPNVKYLIIVEGQASNDGYYYNDKLSYERALSLVNMWKEAGITFDGKVSEVIISGSGASSPFRLYPDIAGNKANQRFVIHIIPKLGKI